MPTSPTTPDAIVGRIVDVIEALVPDSLNSDKFRVHREEVEDFIALCESEPTGALRRFQVLDTGNDNPPETSSGVEEERVVTIQVTVAYPKSGRYGALQGRDRRRVIREDQFKIEKAIGMHGRANFTPATYPDATWLLDGSGADRVDGEACDFLVITQRMLYVLSLA